jgi:hypothetical protein
VVTKRTSGSLRPGVVSATLLEVKYSSSSLDISYGSKDDGYDPEGVGEGTRFLLGTVSSVLTGTP